MISELWWERDDLLYENKTLMFAGKSVQNLAETFQTPSFFYSAKRINENINRLNSALSKTGLDHKIYYAMKANRHVPVLTYMKTTGLCGIDACSPNEVLLALSCGFTPSEISYTATSVSNADIDFLSLHPDLIINCDSISMIKRLGQKCPGRRIGIRINPAMGTGYGSVDVLRYSGEKTTKFGIYKEQFDEALHVAEKYNLLVKRIHFHTGCGYLTLQLDVWQKILEECLWFIKKIDGIDTVNLGGGLGVPHTAYDKAIDLDQWSNIIKKVFADQNISIEVEPGDYIIKDSGMLLLEVNTVEVKKDTTFVGVNGGFNLAVEPFFYSLPCEPVACVIGDAKENIFKKDSLNNVTIAGNINEALDVWIENHPLPEIAEGDFLAMINAGGYAASMSSNHCMRGAVKEFLLM